MRGRYPTEDDQRTLPNAGDSIDEHLSRSFAKSTAGPVLDPHDPGVEGEVELCRRPHRARRRARAGQGHRDRHHEEMRAACESLLAPISETMIDLITRVAPEYQERVRNNVILAGGSALISGLPAALERVLATTAAAPCAWSRIPSSPAPTAASAIALDASEGDWSPSPAEPPPPPSPAVRQHAGSSRSRTLPRAAPSPADMPRAPA